MTEPELSLRIAFYFIENELTKGLIHISIDGAHVKTKDTIHFDIFNFMKSNGWEKVNGDNVRWQGEYQKSEDFMKIIYSLFPALVM